MRVYDGENLKDVDPKAKSVQEYRDAAGVDEGMNGVSTRFAFKVLSETFNYDTEEDRRRSGASDVCAWNRRSSANSSPRKPRPPIWNFIKAELAHALCRVHRP